MKTLKEILDTYTIGTEFSIFDRKFQISAERHCYTQLRKKYMEVADSIYKQYLPIDESYHTIEELVGNVRTIFQQLIDIGIQEVANDAVSVGEISLDKKTIKAECMESWYFAPFYDAYQVFASSLSKIEDDLNDTGVGLAANAYAQDSLGTGVSLIAHAANKKWAKQQRGALISNNALRENLRNGVWASCVNLHCYLIDCLLKRKAIQIGGFITNQACTKAQAIHQNLQQLTLSDEQKTALIFEILELDPYINEFYLTLSQLYPDRLQEIVRASEYFGSRALCDSINVKLVQFVKSSIGTTEEQAIQCRKLLDEKVAEYGMSQSSASSVYQIIDERMQKLDTEYRTVKGIVFDSRDKADMARNDLESYKDMLENPPAFIYRSDYITFMKKIQELPISKEVIAVYVKRYSQELSDFEKKCRKALHYHNIITKKNPFWNGDKSDMKMHYGITAGLFLMGLLAMFYVKAPGFLVLSVCMLIYTVLIKPSIEKKVWESITQNGKYKIEEIVVGAAFLSDFNM